MNSDNMHLFSPHIHLLNLGLLNGLKASSPLLPVVNCQTCVVDDGTTGLKISFFNVLKHNCLINL